MRTKQPWPPCSLCQFSAFANPFKSSLVLEPHALASRKQKHPLFQMPTVVPTAPVTHQLLGESQYLSLQPMPTSSLLHMHPCSKSSSGLFLFLLSFLFFSFLVPMISLSDNRSLSPLGGHHGLNSIFLLFDLWFGFCCRFWEQASSSAAASP